MAERSAIGFVKSYLEARGLQVTRAEEQRLAKGCTGVKKTTGQHAGGLMVVPSGMEIEDFTPIQYPADASAKGVLTTHFDYDAIHDSILKLDLLGHDDPTALKMLGDITGVDVTAIPLDHPDVLSLFSNREAQRSIGRHQQGGNLGAAAIPEFGTQFVRGMLEQTTPATVAELVRVSGLSHGTNVWLNNAEILLSGGTATLHEIICCRDDIMLFLLQKGMAKSDSFAIMEQVRKGRGLTPEQAASMRKHGVPEWYIDSCMKIKYLFPKAHAAAYVMMALRVAWFKVHHPLPFYATYFTVRADDFDAITMTSGQNALQAMVSKSARENKPTDKDEDRAVIAEVCLEMLSRGYSFLPVHLYKSDASAFLIEGDQLRPPLRALPGVGSVAASVIVTAREDGPFLSQEELATRTKVSKTVIETLGKGGALLDLPVSAQYTLFR